MTNVLVGGGEECSGSMDEVLGEDKSLTDVVTGLHLHFPPSSPFLIK